MEQIVTIATMVITMLCGYIATKIPWFNNKLIPIQNILIGVSISVIYYIYSKDISYSVTMAGILSTGVYSLSDNLMELFNQKKEEKQNELSNLSV